MVSCPLAVNSGLCFCHEDTILPRGGFLVYRRHLLVAGIYASMPALQPQERYPLGSVVRLKNTRHMWVADKSGTLHWVGDTIALAGKHINWRNSVYVNFDQIRSYWKSLWLGYPWLSTAFVKIGDPIYLAKWDVDWDYPMLLHVRSIRDMRLFGISEFNYGSCVFDLDKWEKRYGIPVSKLRQGVMPSTTESHPLDKRTIPSRLVEEAQSTH